MWTLVLGVRFVGIFFFNLDLLIQQYKILTFQSYLKQNLKGSKETWGNDETWGAVKLFLFQIINRVYENQCLLFEANISILNSCGHLVGLMIFFFAKRGNFLGSYKPLDMFAFARVMSNKRLSPFLSIYIWLLDGYVNSHCRFTENVQCIFFNIYWFKEYEYFSLLFYNSLIMTVRILPPDIQVKD